MELYGTEEYDISGFYYTENTYRCFCLVMGFVSNKKNTEYHQTYTFKVSKTEFSVLFSPHMTDVTTF